MKEHGSTFPKPPFILLREPRRQEFKVAYNPAKPTTFNQRQNQENSNYDLALNTWHTSQGERINELWRTDRDEYNYVLNNALLSQDSSYINNLVAALFSANLIRDGRKLTQRYLDIVRTPLNRALKAVKQGEIPEIDGIERYTDWREVVLELAKVEPLIAYSKAVTYFETQPQSSDTQEQFGFLIADIAAKAIVSKDKAIHEIGMQILYKNEEPDAMSRVVHALAVTGEYQTLREVLPLIESPLRQDTASRLLPNTFNVEFNALNNRHPKYDIELAKIYVDYQILRLTRSSPQGIRNEYGRRMIGLRDDLRVVVQRVFPETYQTLLGDRRLQSDKTEELGPALDRIVMAVHRYKGSNIEIYKRFRNQIRRTTEFFGSRKKLKNPDGSAMFDDYTLHDGYDVLNLGGNGVELKWADWYGGFAQSPKRHFADLTRSPDIVPKFGMLVRAGLIKRDDDTIELNRIEQALINNAEQIAKSDDEISIYGAVKRWAGSQEDYIQNILKQLYLLGEREYVISATEQIRSIDFYNERLNTLGVESDRDIKSYALQAISFKTGRYLAHQWRAIFPNDNNTDHMVKELLSSIETIGIDQSEEQIREVVKQIASLYQRVPQPLDFIYDVASYPLSDLIIFLNGFKSYTD